MKLSKECISELSAYAYRFALLTLKNKEDAEDVMQEVIYTLLKTELEKTDNSALKAWTYKTTISKCMNLRRNSWFKKRIPLSEEEIFLFPDAEENTDDKIDIIEAFRKLPLKYSNIVYLYDVAGYSVKEISTILNIKESTVYTRLHRGHEKLRKDLKVCAYEI